MEVYRSYKHRLRLSDAQEQRLAQWAGCRRLLWNIALERWQTAYRMRHSDPTVYDLQRELSELRQEYPFFADVPIETLRSVFRDLMRAHQNFFHHRKRYPKYKSRRGRDSLKFTGLIRANDLQRPNQCLVPKLGWLSFDNAYPRLAGRAHEGELMSIIFVREPSGWHAVFRCKVICTPPMHVDRPTIGIDLGVTNSLTLSEGQQLQLPVIAPDEAVRLELLQRRLSRKRLGSQNWHKAQRRLRRQHDRLRHRKVDAIHKCTRALVDRYGFIALEDLDVQELTRARRTSDARPPAVISDLNRRILDQSWGELRRQLRYKADLAGTNVVLVPPMNTSRRCISCGYISKRNRESQAVFHCKRCDYKANADVNAAQNILHVARTGDILRPHPPDEPMDSRRLSASEALRNSNGRPLSKGRRVRSADTATADRRMS